VAAMRIENADAAASGDVLQNTIQEERALAAPSGADDVHVLKARPVVDCEHTAGIVYAKGDEFRRSNDRGGRCRPLSKTRMRFEVLSAALFEGSVRWAGGHGADQFDEMGSGSSMQGEAGISLNPTVKRRALRLNREQVRKLLLLKSNATIGLPPLLARAVFFSFEDSREACPKAVQGGNHFVFFLVGVS